MVNAKTIHESRLQNIATTLDKIKHVIYNLKDKSPPIVYCSNDIKIKCLIGADGVF